MGEASTTVSVLCIGANANTLWLGPPEFYPCACCFM